MPLIGIPDLNFVRRLPKIELHAHLTGSISRKCLQDIWERKLSSQDSLDLEAPVTAMPFGKNDYDVKIFFPLFSSYIYKLCNDVESIEYSTMSVLKDFENDGVVYLELRTTPREITTQGVTKEIYVQTVLSCIENFKSAEMRAFLILSIDRRNSAKEAEEVVQLAVKYQSRGVVGVDLCGDPSKGDVSIYREAFAKAKAFGLRITLHFAEVPASSTALELNTLLSFDPDRLGHVINVPDNIKAEIARRRLGLELCLSCNILAKLTTGGFADHHFGYWRDKGCMIALSTDDVGVFGSSLSNEYLIAAQHFDLGRQQLLDLSLQATKSIFGPEAEKRRIANILEVFKDNQSLK